MTEILKENLRGRRLAVIGHGNSDFDSIAAGVLLTSHLVKCGIDARFLIPDGYDGFAGRYLPLYGVEPQTFCGKPNVCDALFLVDCHDTVYKNEVIGIIDHHPTRKKPICPFYMNVSSSSCALTVLRLIEKVGDTEISPAFYAMTAMSVYIDTQSLKSSKLVASDLGWLSQVTKKYRLDSGFMTRCGYCETDMSLPVDALTVNNMKEYKYGTYTVRCSHIQCVSLTSDVKENILATLDDKRRGLGVDVWIMIFTDPEREISEMVKITDGDREYRCYNRLISRSIDIMPEIEKEYCNKCK